MNLYNVLAMDSRKYGDIFAICFFETIYKNLLTII